MNLQKTLVISLPIVASLAIVGTGFASWYFQHQDVEKSTNVSVHTYAQVTKGKINITQSPSLVVFSTGIGKKEDLTDGLEFYRNNDGSNVKDDKIILNYTIEDENDAIEGNDFRMFVTIESTGSNDNELSSYLAVTSTYEDATSASGYDFSKDIQSIAPTDGNKGYFRYTVKLNDVIQYKDSNHKPLTSETYNSLKSAIESSDTTITVKFVVK